jgi:hypothetical protein
MAIQEVAAQLSSVEEQAPYWEIVAVGQSVLLAYHSCDGTSHKRLSRHDREQGLFLCTECGSHHRDSLHPEPAAPGAAQYPLGRTRG